ncbi:hypothetical protein SPONL_438 [uncultured Candidatus Thioglobus sp.]|nr:hypothetical protein SPONL_438 [uncultured Candidatus Thioglobus sp.]
MKLDDASAKPRKPLNAQIAPVGFFGQSQQIPRSKYIAHRQIDNVPKFDNQALEYCYDSACSFIYSG